MKPLPVASSYTGGILRKSSSELETGHTEPKAKSKAGRGWNTKVF
jgi:hypothetical protein